MLRFSAKILPGLGDLARGQPRIIAILWVFEAVGYDAATVDSFPPVKVVRKRISFVPRQLVGEKKGYPGGCQELRKVAGEAEGIREPRHFCTATEPTFEVVLPKKQLTNPRLARREIPVRFNPHASDDFPRTFANSSADLVEKQGIALFNPGVELRARLIEPQLWIPSHQADYVVKGSLSLSPG